MTKPKKPTPSIEPAQLLIPMPCAVCRVPCAVCRELGMRYDESNKRFFCFNCQSDGNQHKDGDFSTVNGWKCHKCGWKGDAFDLVKEVRGIEFPAAVVFLGEEYKVHGDNGTGSRDERPCVLLPCGEQEISQCGRLLGKHLERTGCFFVRGRTVVKLRKDRDEMPVLEVVLPKTMASDFESVSSLLKLNNSGDTVHAICSEQFAKMIMSSDAFAEELPPIHLLRKCPVLIERAGKLEQISGYDRESGIMAHGGPLESIDLVEAKNHLDEILREFRFAAPSDRARALAALITPALVHGKLLSGRAPLDLGKADQSQTGKGYRNKLTAAVYNQLVQTVSQKKGGVGSLQETFDSKLVRGAGFVSLDNIKGMTDCPFLEMFLTEDSYPARVPYHDSIDIDPARIAVMMTSNKAEITPDLANRSSCERVLKQAADYYFKEFPEGDILDHVRANPSRYLEAVFAVVRAWYEEEKPRTRETRHLLRHPPTRRRRGANLSSLGRLQLRAGALFHPCRNRLGRQ